MGLRIVASAMAVPTRIETAEELAESLDRSADWVIGRSGVRQRHIGDDDLDSPVLAAQAARLAMEGQPPPDLLLYCGAVPHQAIPDTSVFVSQQLGYEGIPSFSVDASCLSFLVALKTADALISSGTYKRILICACDLASRARNMDHAESAALLGDGAAAALVEHTDSVNGLLHFAMKTWPAGATLAQICGGGTRALLADEMTQPDANLFQMDGRGLLRMLGPKVNTLVQESCEAAGIRIVDIDLVVPHQTSKAGFEMLSRMGIPKDKTINILAQYGNCVSASMPMALATAMANDRLRSGNIVLFVGTASGASAALAIMRW